MNRLGSTLTLIYDVGIWAMFIIGVAVQNAWLAAPAAFLILLEALDQR